MAKFLLMVFVFVAGVSIALAAEWSYDPNAADGPSHWGDLCDGQKQSPINIVTSATKYDSGLGAQWNFVNYDSNPGARFEYKCSNDGHTLKVSFEPPFFYNVSGGGLTGTYTTVQFHLHWGSNSTNGSEHTVDGHQFPAEIHFVSYNTKYNNLSTALGHMDGLAVLGVFLEVGESENAAYQNFLSSTNQLVNKDSEVNLDPFNLGPLLPPNTSKFYRYNGSLTTPTCNEAVTWTVFDQTVKISQAQLDALFTLKLNSTMHILNNYRPVQNLNGRVVMDSFKAPPTTSSTAATTSSTAATTSSTATTPSVKGDDGIALKISNAVLLLMLFGALFLR